MVEPGIISPWSGVKSLLATIPFSYARHGAESHRAGARVMLPAKVSPRPLDGPPTRTLPYGLGEAGTARTRPAMLSLHCPATACTRLAQEDENRPTGRLAMSDAA